MKTVYIPKGETVSYETLVTEKLVVKGCLKVTYGIKAKSISGDGVICAGTVEADDIRLDSLEAATVICKRLIAKRVQAPELFASESAVVSCFLSSAYVETGKLTVTISEVDEVKAQEVINLPPKKRSLLGLLLISALRSIWTVLTTPVDALDAEYEVIVEESADSDKETAVVDEAETQAEAPVETKNNEPVDEELNRFINTFKLLRESGFTLKVIPGTPEENAPVFDFENQRIIRPAA